MLLRRFLTKNRKADSDQSSLENDGTPSTSTYTSNVTTAPSHTLSGRDSVREPDETQSSLTDTIGVAENSNVSTTNYIYYRIYAEDRAIPSKTRVAAGDPFLGRIKARSVPPPRTVKAVKRSIAEVENIKCTNATIFLTPYSQSPMRDAEKVTILNGTGPGSTPQEPLALVAEMSYSERSVLESDGRSGLTSAAEPDTTSAEIRYVFYRIYAEDGAIPSKTPITPGDPFIGRIKVISVPPPRTAKIVKCSIAKAENIKDGESTSLFLTPYSQSPMGDAEKVTILNGTGPGSTPQEPLVLVAKMSYSERSVLESDGRSGLASAAEPDTTSPEIRYVFYRIYAEDGAIPSKTHITPGDPFLGRIKVISMPPPHTAKTIKCSIAKVENIKDGECTSLFLTPYSKSPMDEANKVIIINRTGTGPGSTPQEPLALVAKMSDSERSALDSEGRSGLASAAGRDTTSPEIRYLYYLLYGINYEMPSKVAFDPEEPSLGRIRADSVPPPHGPASIKRCISRVEKNPALAWPGYANLFADTSCDTPFKEGHISIFPTDGPGLSPNEPMAIVQVLLPVKTPSIPDGKYIIKNRAADIYWCAAHNPIQTVYFFPSTLENCKTYEYMQWNITQDADGNISMTSPYAPSSWVGAEMSGSTVPVPWQLIPADSNFYYLTTDSRYSQNPRVPAMQKGRRNVLGTMASLKEGDQWQMWEFIRI